jgi:cytoskeletal protein RodZ
MIDIITAVVFFLIAAAWWQAIRTCRKYPERFSGEQKAVWQIAKEMANNRTHQPQADSESAHGQQRSQRQPSLYPISFW